jgi:N-acetylglucosaminyl-diphospho-decaprenol L-rhamnosyltransferase
MAFTDITIIITTFKSDKAIEDCLKSIDTNCKVIIIENSGNKNFKEDIEKRYKNIECIVSEENLGYGKANNYGLKKVKTKYALVLNPDTILETNALNNFLIAAEKKPNFSLIGPDQNHEEKKNENSLIEVKNLKGFAIFFNLEQFTQKHFFDEEYFLYYEEIDLCRRVINDKGKIFLDKNIKIKHEGAKSVDPAFSFEVEKNRNWHWMWSTFYYHKKFNNFYLAFLKVFPKLISSLFKTVFYYLTFNNEKKSIYQCRLNGLINSICGKKSWYRPSLD